MITRACSNHTGYLVLCSRVKNYNNMKLIKGSQLDNIESMSKATLV